VLFTAAEYDEDVDDDEEEDDNKPGTPLGVYDRTVMTRELAVLKTAGPVGALCD
jgi:hypothetical protein